MLFGNEYYICVCFIIGIELLLVIGIIIRCFEMVIGSSIGFEACWRYITLSIGAIGSFGWFDSGYNDLYKLNWLMLAHKCFDFNWL